LYALEQVELLNTISIPFSCADGLQLPQSYTDLDTSADSMAPNANIKQEPIFSDGEIKNEPVVEEDQIENEPAPDHENEYDQVMINIV
jgi:hypothetical protein